MKKIAVINDLSGLGKCSGKKEDFSRMGSIQDFFLTISRQTGS